MSNYALFNLTVISASHERHVGPVLYWRAGWCCLELPLCKLVQWLRDWRGALCCHAGLALYSQAQWHCTGAVDNTGGPRFPHSSHHFVAVVAWGMKLTWSSNCSGQNLYVFPRVTNTLQIMRLFSQLYVNWLWSVKSSWLRNRANFIHEQTLCFYFLIFQCLDGLTSVFFDQMQLNCDIFSVVDCRY